VRDRATKRERIHGSGYDAIATGRWRRAGLLCVQIEGFDHGCQRLPGHYGPQLPAG
jgi:hypothetical protein